MRSLSILFRQCSYPVVHMKMLYKLSFFVLFSSPVDPIQALLIITFSSFQIPSHVGAPLNHSPIAIHLSGVLKRSQKAPLFIQDQLNLVRGCYLIQAI